MRMLTTLSMLGAGMNQDLQEMRQQIELAVRELRQACADYPEDPEPSFWARLQQYMTYTSASLDLAVAAAKRWTLEEMEKRYGTSPADSAITEWRALPWYVRLYWWVRG